MFVSFEDKERCELTVPANKVVFRKMREYLGVWIDVGGDNIMYELDEINSARLIGQLKRFNEFFYNQN